MSSENNFTEAKLDYLPAEIINCLKMQSSINSDYKKSIFPQTTEWYYFIHLLYFLFGFIGLHLYL